LIAVPCVVALAIGFLAGVQIIPGVAMGLFAGCLLRDVGWSLKTALAWPTTNEIINWDRVEQLLNHD
jgi:hypothetical protein